MEQEKLTPMQAYKIGDIVYLYITAPYKRVEYKMVVLV